MDESFMSIDENERLKFDSTEDKNDLIHRINAYGIKVLPTDTFPLKSSLEVAFPQEQVSAHVQRIQSFFLRYKDWKRYNTHVKTIEKRNSAVIEIYTTEKSYVHALRTMIGLYINPLEAESYSGEGLVTKKDISTIFSNIPVLFNLNEMMLKDLEERMSNYHTHQLIGDIFINLASFFKLYGEYCQNYGRSIAHLKKVMAENSRFRNFIEQINGIKDDLHDIYSFLIMPVQRIPRYILLLENVLRFTWDEHPDKSNIEKSLEEWRSVAFHVNESMNAAQSLDTLLKIEQRIGNAVNLVDPARRFIKEGKINKITSRVIVKPTYFLFNDILIYAYEGKYKGTINLSTCWVRDIEDTETLKNAFQIIAYKKTYTLYTDTPLEKKEWISALNDVILRLVTINPYLVELRTQKIRKTHRLAKFLWNTWNGYDEVTNDAPENVRRDYIAFLEEEAERKRNLTVNLTSLKSSGEFGWELINFNEDEPLDQMEVSLETSEDQLLLNPGKKRKNGCICCIL